MRYVWLNYFSRWLITYKILISLIKLLNWYKLLIIRLCDFATSYSSNNLHWRSSDRETHCSQTCIKRNKPNSSCIKKCPVLSLGCFTFTNQSVHTRETVEARAIMQHRHLLSHLTNITVIGFSCRWFIPLFYSISILNIYRIMVGLEPIDHCGCQILVKRLHWILFQTSKPGYGLRLWKAWNCN